MAGPSAREDRVPYRADHVVELGDLREQAIAQSRLRARGPAGQREPDPLHPLEHLLGQRQTSLSRSSRARTVSRSRRPRASSIAVVAWTANPSNISASSGPNISSTAACVRTSMCGSPVPPARRPSAPRAPSPPRGPARRRRWCGVGAASAMSTGRPASSAAWVIDLGVPAERPAHSATRPAAAVTVARPGSASATSVMAAPGPGHVHRGLQQMLELPLGRELAREQVAGEARRGGRPASRRREASSSSAFSTAIPAAPASAVSSCSSSAREVVPALALGDIEVAVDGAAGEERHPEEGVHGRVLLREADRRFVGAQVRQTHAFGSSMRVPSMPCPPGARRCARRSRHPCRRGRNG